MTRERDAYKRVTNAVIADGSLSTCILLYRGQSREAGEGDPYWHEYHGRIADALQELLKLLKEGGG